MLVPSALEAQQLRDTDWKGWSASWKSYAKALQRARPVGRKVLGERGHALCDWIVPRLTGEKVAGTPSLTTVFGLIGRDLRAAQECAGTSAPEVSPGRAYSCRLQAGPDAGGPRPLALPKLRAGRRTCMPSGICGSMSVADPCGNACWCRPYKWRHAAPLLILAEAQSKASLADPPFQDYTRHVVLPAHGKTGSGLGVYIRAGTTTRASLLWGKEDANALLMEVLTPSGRHHVLAAHAPQINIGCEPHVRWWAGMWCEVTCIADPATVLVVTDTNSPARPADRGTPLSDDTQYRTFLQAFNLRDLVDLQPVPQGTYSCFQGTARSCIDAVACHREATFTIASYHYWGSTLLSDHHVPLFFTVAHPLVRLDKPSPNPVSRTPEYHLGPVALSPADTADFQSSVLRKRDIDSQLGPTLWLKGLQRAIYDWAHAVRKVWALRFRHPASGHARQIRPPPRSPLAAFPGAQYAPLRGKFYADSQSMLGNSVAAGHALKQSLVELGEAQRQLASKILSAGRPGAHKRHATSGAPGAMV